MKLTFKYKGRDIEAEYDDRLYFLNYVKDVKTDKKYMKVFCVFGNGFKTIKENGTFVFTTGQNLYGVYDYVEELDIYLPHTILISFDDAERGL
jgi:hypothetical protein